MAFEVERLTAHLDAVLDDRNFDRFDARIDKARRDTKSKITADVGADVDSRDVGKVEGFFRRIRGEARNDAKLDVKADVDRSSFSSAERAMKQTTDASGGVVRGQTRMRSGFSSLMVGGAGIAAVGAGFYGLAKGIGFVTSAFGESEAVQKQTQTVLKSTKGAAGLTADAIGDLATKVSRYSGLDDEAVQSGENLLLTFTNVRNEVGKGNDVFTQATKIAADMSTALGQDLKSSNIQLGKALNDPIKGITALSRVGVSFTEQQKDQIKTLVASGKTMDAQKLILGELRKEFGGSAKAAGDTFSGSVNKMKTALGNVAEVIGGKLAPILRVAADFITKLANGFGDGSKASDGIREKLSALGAVVSGIGSVFQRVFGFIQRIVNDNRDTIDRFVDVAKKNFAAVMKFVGQVGASFNKVFGGSTGVGKDIRGIVRVIGQFLATVAEVSGKIARRLLPAIGNAFEGVMKIVRGVIRVVSGILHGDFKEAWQGAKDIVSGAVKAIGSVLSGAGGLILGALKKGFSGAMDWLESLPGKFLDAGTNAANKLIQGIGKIPGLIKGAFTGIGDIVGGIASSLAQWLNDHTPFGDTIVNVDLPGPLPRVKITLPNLATGGRPDDPNTALGEYAIASMFGMEVNRGGKGKPGKMRAFITDEGQMPEWVISQQGDRRSNVNWAKEALETLTGKEVSLHADGKGKKIKQAPVPAKNKKANAGIQRSIARKNKGIGAYEQQIQDMETRYDETDRRYGISDETVLIDGTGYYAGAIGIDEDARSKREKELKDLKEQRKKIKAKIEEYRKAVNKAVKALKKGIRRLDTLIKSAAGKSRSKERKKYIGERQGYVDRLGEYEDVAHDLGFDITDSHIDLLELNSEIDANSAANWKLEADAQNSGWTPATADTGTGTGDTGTGGTDDGTGGSTDTTTAAATPEQIAAAAAEQLASFQASRADLFSSFGSNFAQGGKPAFGDETAQAAGMRYYGASDGNEATHFNDGAIQKQINVTQNYARGPEDPMTYSRGLEFELGAV